jgi:hypothetical protein
MIKSVLALAIFGLMGAAVVALPSLVPQADARVAVGSAKQDLAKPDPSKEALVKADRIDSQPVARNCSQQVWPNFDTACLHHSESGVVVHEARLVTARR